MKKKTLKSTHGISRGGPRLNGNPYEKKTRGISENPGPCGFFAGFHADFSPSFPQKPSPGAMPRSVSTATNMTVMTTFTDASGPSTAAGALHGLTWP